MDIMKKEMEKIKKEVNRILIVEKYIIWNENFIGWVL